MMRSKARDDRPRRDRRGRGSDRDARPPATAVTGATKDTTAADAPVADASAAEADGAEQDPPAEGEKEAE